MATLDYLVKTLGPAVARLVASPEGADVEIGDVIIHDPADPFELGNGDLVVAPGIVTPDDAVVLLRDLAGLPVAAVMLKDPIAEEPSLVRVAQTCGVAVISVPKGASWAQIVSLVQTVAATGAGYGDEPAQAQSPGDLFALAEAIAVAVDAPVTIEDQLSRVIAYSQHQDKADSVRAQTILGRRAPEPIIARLSEQGIFTRLKQSSEPIYVDLRPDMGPRVAVGVRAGQEDLGSIWAAVPGPPTGEQLAALADAARLATLHLLRHRAGADVERKIRADLLATLLEGKAGAADAAHRLGLQEAGLRVLAVAPGVGDDEAGDMLGDELRTAVATHLEFLHVRGAAALMGGLIYAVIQVEGPGQASAERATRIASGFLQRVGGRAASAMVGVGGYAETVAELARSRREAEEALRILRVSPERGPVVVIDDVRLPALLERLLEVTAQEAALYDAEIKPLIESDKTRGTAYLETLRAYLVAFGDLGGAGELLHVHANTVRYRLRRIQEMTTIDLDDPDERLGLMLLLRIVANRHS